ncbi:MAG: biopolymer transporter ExbD [bacterium]
MAKLKKKRLSVKIDMTPMVDVAMLLLTFFMMTTSFRPPEIVQIEMPEAHADVVLPETNVMTITVGKNGDLFVGLDSQRDRVKIFGEAARLRKGEPISDIKELPDIIQNARVSNIKLRTVIKGDKGAPYAKVEDVMRILQQLNITRFSFVTEVEKS